MKKIEYNEYTQEEYNKIKNDIEKMDSEIENLGAQLKKELVSASASEVGDIREEYIKKISNIKKKKAEEEIKICNCKIVERCATNDCVQLGSTVTLLLSFISSEKQEEMTKTIVKERENFDDSVLNVKSTLCKLIMGLSVGEKVQGISDVKEIQIVSIQ